MNPTSAFRRNRACQLAAVSIGITLALCVRGPAALAQSTAAKPSLPTDIAAILPWFPTDTETLIVARDVDPGTSLRSAKAAQGELTDEQRQALKQQAMAWLTKSLTVGNFWAFSGDPKTQAQKFVNSFGDRHLPLVVYGGRKYEIVSAFGTYRYHGASVRIFAQEATDDVERGMLAIEKNAGDVRTFSGQRVLVFPANKEGMESRYRIQPWQGVFVTRVQPNVVICATSDTYLKEMLARVETKAEDRALPDDLPEWKFIDTTASTWGLRHIPPVKEQQLTGLAWFVEPAAPGALEVFYLPTTTGSTEQPAQSWFMQHDEKAGKLVFMASRKQYIQQLPDRTTRVTIDLDNTGDGKSPGLPIFNIYRLQGQPGTW